MSSRNNKREILKYASLNALGTALYIIFLVSGIFFIGDIVEERETAGGGDSIFGPIVMLMLFVFSAALTGSLVFGRPILWYIDGKKKDALLLLSYTLGIFLIITIVMALILFFTII